MQRLLRLNVTFTSAKETPCAQSILIAVFTGF